MHRLLFKNDACSNFPNILLKLQFLHASHFYYDLSLPQKDMKNTYRLSILLLLSFLFSGCYGTKEQVKKVQESLPGEWELVALVYEKNTLDGLFPGKRPRLVFDTEGTMVNGYNGCNTFSCPIFTNRLSLTFLTKKMKSTKMACSNDGEATFNKLLNSITSYRIDEQNELELFIKTQRIMTLRRVLPDE